MKKLAFQFKNIELDHMVAYNALKSEHYKNVEITDQIYSQLQRDAYVPLIEGYLAADKIDEIIDYTLDQWDNRTHGFDLFVLISDGLIAKRDIERLVLFWKSVVMSRFIFGHTQAAFEALSLMRAALESVGDSSAADELQTKLEKKKKKRGENKVGQKLHSPYMTETHFWQLIGKAKGEGKQTTSQVILRAANIKDLLVEMTADDVQQFSNIFDRKMNQSYSWGLWAIAYIAFGGCGDDKFEYFRAWLISEGKETYDALVADPERIADLPIKPHTLESLLYVPEDVYSEMTGNELVRSESKETEPSGEEWEETEEALKNKFPKTYARFNI